jgi:hypothetical protein
MRVKVGKDYITSFGLETIACRLGVRIQQSTTSAERTVMNAPLIAILVAVPLIAAFFLFVLLPRLRRHEEKKKSRGE